MEEGSILQGYEGADDISVRYGESFAFLKGGGCFGGVANLGVIIRQGHEHGWVARVCLGAVLQQAEAFGFISKLSQTGGNAEKGLGIGSVRNPGVLIESDDGLVVLLREISFTEVSAGEFIGMIEGEGPPEPRAPLGAQPLLHVA